MAHEPSKDLHVQPQDDQAAADVQGCSAPLLVDEHLPARLTAVDMQRLFNVGKSQFFKRVMRGDFDRFQLSYIGGRRAWSGHLVEKYLRADDGSSRFVRSKPRPKVKPISLFRKLG